jgi:hypothetical protein
LGGGVVLAVAQADNKPAVANPAKSAVRRRVLSMKSLDKLSAYQACVFAKYQSPRF